MEIKPILLRTSLDEELSQISLPIAGTVPDWLQGTLIRNGPAKFESGGQCIVHWFDGLAMLHAFTFQHGEVVYTNRFIRSYAYDQVMNHDSIHYTGFMADPCRSLFRKLFTQFFPWHTHEIENANINVAKFADRYVALTETPLPVEFDLHTLHTLGVFDYEDRLPKQDCWQTAHPHTDALTHETISYLVRFGRKPAYVLYSMEEHSSTRNVIAEIPVSQPSYMHSFSITENFIILSEYPFVVNPLQLLTGKGFIQNYVWKPELQTCFTVVNKHTGELVERYCCDPFFAFHHINAYEEEDTIILDCVAYQDPEIVFALANYGEMMHAPQSEVTRFTIHLNTGVVHKQILSQMQMELPRIHPEWDGKPYRYLYGADLREIYSSNEQRSIYKLDTQTRSVQQWSAPHCCPGEPVFVPLPGSRHEEEGIILAIVLDLEMKNSFLLILDATSFTEIGRAEIPHHIPAGLHGQYFT